MNLVLFEPKEWHNPLPWSDHRAQHLRDILKLAVGDRFAAGIVGGPVGSLEITEMSETACFLGKAHWNDDAPRPARIVVLIGTPRPPTARRLLKDLTTLGALELHFAATDLGDKSYLQSNLWKGEFRSALLEGAAQTRTTYLPSVFQYPSLWRALKAIDDQHSGPGVWFDAGGCDWTRHPIHEEADSERVLKLALGPERGWTDVERERLKAAGWHQAGLGPRVLRTETACTLAVGVAVLREWT